MRVKFEADVVLILEAKYKKLLSMDCIMNLHSNVKITGKFLARSICFLKPIPAFVSEVWIGNNLHCIRGALDGFTNLKKFNYAENPRLNEKTGRAKCKKAKCEADFRIFNSFPVKECNFFDYSQAINSGQSSGGN